MKTLQDILSRQTKYGAFTSVVKMKDETIAEDENMFITALVLFELLLHEKTPELVKAISRAVDFIEACETQRNTGIFTFYPDKLPSSKLHIPLYADADDSALAILILVHTGRRTREWAQSILAGVFENNRILYTNSHPPWVKRGIFKTWINDDYDNPADSCVNINILALYAYLELNHTDVYKIALNTVKHALTSTALDPLHMRQLAPFYAHPCEVYESIKRAVYFGVNELVTELNVFQHMESHRTDDTLRPVCCNYWGQPLWFSSVLAAARLTTAFAPDINTLNNVL
jgi:hypothetical protein